MTVPRLTMPPLMTLHGPSMALMAGPRPAAPEPAASGQEQGGRGRGATTATVAAAAAAAAESGPLSSPVQDSNSTPVPVPPVATTTTTTTTTPALAPAPRPGLVSGLAKNDTPLPPQAFAPAFSLSNPPPSILSVPARPLSQPIAASSQHGNGAHAHPRRSIASPSSAFSSSSPPLPSLASHHHHHRRHPSSHRQQQRQYQRASVARAPKRESSLPSSLPAVLPALPALIPVHPATKSPVSTKVSPPTMLASPSSPAPASLCSDKRGEDVLAVTTPPELESHHDPTGSEVATAHDDDIQDMNDRSHSTLMPKQSQDGLNCPPLPLSTAAEESESGSGSGSGSNIPDCSESAGERVAGSSFCADTVDRVDKVDHLSPSTTSLAVVASSTSCSSSLSTSSSSSSSSSSAPTTVSAPTSMLSIATTTVSCPSGPQQPLEQQISSSSSHPQRQASPSSPLPSPSPPPPPPKTPGQQQQHSWKQSPQHYLDQLKETVTKAELGNILSRESDSFHQAVLELYMERFDFRKDPIDLALRKFLLDFHFPKEAQQIDRVLQAFANRYHACNFNLFRSSDVVYTLSFSLMLLHTDAHNKNVRFKMTKEQYIKQAKSIEGVSTIPADILEILYDNITFLKFVYAEDDLDVTGQKMAEVQNSSWFPRRRTASTQRSDSYNMIRHGSITQLSPDLSDLIPFRWPYYWKGTIELVDNVQINNQFTKAPSAFIPGLRCREPSTSFDSTHFPSHASHAHSRADQLSSADRIDSPADTIRAISFEHSTEGGMSVAPNASAEAEAIELRVVKQGILSRKIDIENGKKSTVRGWRELGVILSGSQLLFFTDLSWFHQQRRLCHGGFNPEAPPEVDGYFANSLSEDPPPMPQALISTHDAIAVVDSSYQKYPHVFRLACPNGKQYLFRADNEREMNDWMSKINYATAFRTAGVRLRNYRVAWADDVIWIRDDQGRYQLRKRRKRSSTQDTLQAQQQQLVQQQYDESRAGLIKTKLKDIDNLIHSCAASLTNELRFTRNLEVMIPLQPSTRQKIILSATEAGKRLRHLMLERTKLDCYRTILERDLAVVVAPTAIRTSYWGVAQRQGEGESQPTTMTAVSSSGALEESSQPGTPLGNNTDPQREWMQERVKEALHQGSRTPVSATSLDPSPATSPAKAKSPRPKMALNDFSRTVSESVLDEHHRHQRAVTVDFPHGPAAIQAAIIDAARGGSGLITASPDSSIRPHEAHHERHHERHHSAQEHSTKAYRNTIMVPRPNHPSPSANQSPSNTAPSSPSTPVAPVFASGPGSAPNSTMTSPLRPKAEAGSPGLLSPNAMTTNSRSRALSLPPGAQRPPMPGTPLMTMNMPRTVSIYSSSSQTANRLKKILEQGLNHFKRRSKKDAKGGAGGSLGGSIVHHATGSTPSVSSSGSSISNGLGGGGSGQGSSTSQLHQTRVSTSLSLSRTSSSIGSLREWSSAESGSLGESLLPAVRPSIGSSSGGDTVGSRSGTPRIQMISQWESDDGEDEESSEGEGEEEKEEEEEEEEEDGDAEDVEPAETCSEGEEEADGEHIVVSPPSPPSVARFQLDLSLGSDIDLLPASLSLTSDSHKDAPPMAQSMPDSSVQMATVSSTEGEEEEQEPQEKGESGPVSALRIQSATPSDPSPDSATIQ